MNFNLSQRDHKDTGRSQKHTHIHKDIGAHHKNKSKSPQNQKKKNTIENEKISKYILHKEINFKKCRFF